MDKEIAGMKQEITDIKQDITGMKQEITDIKQDITGMKGDIQGLKGSVDLLNVKVDRNARRLKELDLSVRTQNLAIRNLKSSSDKKFIRLQDGMDTVETILKMNNLIPG